MVKIVFTRLVHIDENLYEFLGSPEILGVIYIPNELGFLKKILPASFLYLCPVGRLDILLPEYL
jgi:hypothetical protein